MIRTEFAAALNQVCSEHGIEPEVVIEALKNALAAAYRKDYGKKEQVEVEINEETGEVKILKEGKDVTPEGFGRIAAQTAKQVILQRIREAEKQAILESFTKKIGQVINGMIQRFEGPNIIVDIGRTLGKMPASEQVSTENYRLNQRLKVLIKEIRKTPRGPEIILSRTDKDLVPALFSIEVPEVGSGSVEIKGIAREPGFRSKLAVYSHRDGVDPIGSCIGQKGVRVKTITSELGEEKIDIIQWSSEPAKFITASLSPAKVSDIEVKPKKKEAVVFVEPDQFSLAIGKEGQNVRLAAKLTGWRIDIKSAEQRKKKKVDTEKAEAKKEETELEKAGLPKRVANVLEKAGITNIDQLKEKSEGELKKIKGLGPKGIGEMKKIAK